MVWSLLDFERAANLAQQQNVPDRGVAKEFLLAKNLGVGKFRSALSDHRVAFFDGEKAK